MRKDAGHESINSDSIKDLMQQLAEHPIADDDMAALESCRTQVDLFRTGFRVLVERRRKDLVFAWKATCLLETVRKRDIAKAVQDARRESRDVDLFGVQDADVFWMTVKGFKWFGIFCPKCHRVGLMLELGKDPNELESEAIEAFAEIENWIWLQKDPDEPDEPVCGPANNEEQGKSDPPEEYISKPMPQSKAALKYFAHIDYSKDHKERLFREMVLKAEVWARQLNPPKGRLYQFDIREIEPQTTGKHPA